MKTSRRMLFALPLAAAAMIATAQTRPAMQAPGAATAPATYPDVVTKYYPIGDLIHPPVDYPINPERKADEGPRDHASVCFIPPASAQDTTVLVEAITQEIQDTIDWKSWKVNGGTMGAIQESGLSPCLIVVQTPENQIAIARLLKEIREERQPRTISARATWLLIDDRDVRAIQAQARKDAPPGATAGALVVDDAILDRAGRYAAAQTTCFDGQTVSLTSQRSWSIVTDVNPVVGTGAVGYDPTTDRATSGATLQLTPRLTPDGAVIVDLRSLVTETRPPAPRPASQPTEGFDKTMIDPQDIATQQIATTARLPLGKRVIVAGSTLPPSVGGDRGGRTLYLVMEIDAVR